MASGSQGERQLLVFFWGDAYYSGLHDLDCACRQKDVMKKNTGKNVAEKRLFHGTDTKYIDAICLNNFDWRICGTHGTAYGKGWLLKYVFFYSCLHYLHIFYLLQV